MSAMPPVACERFADLYRVRRSPRRPVMQLRVQGSCTVSENHQCRIGGHMQCTNCGNVILQKKKFCKHCGVQITGLPDLSNQTQDVGSRPNPVQVTGDVKLVEAGISSV